jgi:hypothetical protein
MSFKDCSNASGGGGAAGKAANAGARAGSDFADDPPRVNRNAALAIAIIDVAAAIVDFDGSLKMRVILRRLFFKSEKA